MRSHGLNVMVAVRLVWFVMILGMLFGMSVPVSFAQSGNAMQVSDQETPEVEMYKNDAGEWKVRYVSSQTSGAQHNGAKDAEVIDIDDVEVNTDVDLYQDESGEWKVRYVPAKSSMKEKVAVENSVKASSKESVFVPAQANGFAQVQKENKEAAAVPVKETAEKKIEKDIDAQIKEQMESSAKELVQEGPAIVKTSHEIKKEVPSTSAAVNVASTKEAKTTTSPVAHDETAAKTSLKKSVKEPLTKDPVDEFMASTEKIEFSLAGVHEDSMQVETGDNIVEKSKVVSATIDDKPVPVVERSPVSDQKARMVNENLVVPMDANELKNTLEPVSVPESAFIEERRPVNSERDVYMPIRSFRNPNHHIELGVEAFQYNFAQKSLMNNLRFEVAKKNEGVLYGLHGGYEYVPDNPEKQSLMDLIRHFDDVNRYKVTLDFRTGSAEYSDRNFDGFDDDFNHNMVEAKAVAGYDFRLIQNTRFTPFMGLGYRYHLDPSGTIIDAPPGTIHEAGTTSTFSSVGFDVRQPYEVQSHYFYVPIGMMTNTDISDSWSLGLNLEADVVFLGLIKSSFSDLGSLYVEDGVANPRTLKLKNTTNDLKTGIGFRGSTRLTRKQNNFDWYIEPFIRYWHINKSEDEQYPLKVNDGKDVVLVHSDGSPYNWTEPESSTTEYGLQVGVVY